MAAGQLQIPYSMPALTATGEVAAGATLTVYNTGTNVVANLYSNSALSVAINNPLTANSAGRFTDQATVIWASDAQAYDALLSFTDGSSLTFTGLNVLELQQSLGAYAPINSPTFTGVPTAPSPATNDNSNKIATTGFVQSQGFAPLNSPALTGAPTAPTQAAGTNTTTVATTAFATTAANGTTNTFTTTSILKVLPGGLIVQSGQVVASINEGNYTVNFPIAFPNACVFANAIMNNSGAAVSTPTGIVLAANPTTTQAKFSLVGYQSGTINPVNGLSWIAFGY